MSLRSEHGVGDGNALTTAASASSSGTLGSIPEGVSKEGAGAGSGIGDGNGNATARKVSGRDHDGSPRAQPQDSDGIDDGHVPPPPEDDVDDMFS